jgi:AraC-like DNA-binding protein
MLVPVAALARLAERRTQCSHTMPLQQWLVDDATLHAELWALCDELKAPLVAADCESRLATSLVRLLGHAIEQLPASRTVSRQPVDGLRPLADYLREHVTDNVSLDQMSTTVGLSKFYLLRAFRRAYGFTPHAYQMHLRLARAWRLIAEGTPLSWAAYDAGFADQSHLTRRFAALFGLTPGSLARQLTPRTRVAEPAAISRREIIAPSAA